MALKIDRAAHRELRVLFQAGTVSGLTDGQLLERFTTLGGEAAERAFAALVDRHGPLVLGASRAILRHEQDAQDAFQATFLILVRRARTLWVRDSLGPWLHRVACHTAARAGRAAVRRREVERKAAEMMTGRDDGEDRREIGPALHEEIDRLPARYRVPVVLCDLEGRSYEEAARHLNCPVGTLKSRLCRGRERLRDRLTRRGLAPTTAPLGLAWTIGGEARAAMPAALENSTARAAMSYIAGSPAAGMSASIAALTEAMIKEMTMARASIMAAAVVVACTLASGGFWLRGHTGKERSPGQTDATRGDGTRPQQWAGRIVWGQAVDGLQLGLAVAQGEPAARLGESAKFVVWVRNVGGQPAKLAYRAGWFYTSPPVVVDGDGKPAKVTMPPKIREDVPIFDKDGKKVPGPPQPDQESLRPVLELSVGPGQSIELNSVAVALAPASEEGPVDRPTARLTPGAWKLGFRGLSTSHPKLETGQAEIVVGRAAAPGDEHEAGPLGEAAKRLVGTWQGEDGGAGPTYHADGKGKNPNGSSFEWRLEGDILVARRSSPDGQPGDWSRTVILFSRDAQEYRLVLDKEYRFFRLLPDGKRDDQRTEEGRSFPLKKTPREEQGDIPTPTVIEPGPARDAARPAPAADVYRVGPNVHVSGSNAGILHAEVVIAADPADARRLVAASMYAPPPVDPSAPKIVVYASTDGGKSWAPTLERNDVNPASLADPAFAWGASDALFLVNMRAPSLDRLTDAGCLQMVRSRDGGRTWGPTTTIKSHHDRPFLAVDRSGGRNQGRLYCLVHDGLLVSTDSGQSFGPLRTWARRPDFLPYGSGNPLMLSDGTLVVLYNNSAKRETEAQQKTGPDHDRRYLGVRTSRDGDSFSEEAIVAEYRGAGYPTAAVSPAQTPWPDRIHVVWQEFLPGGHHCVSYAGSKDRGRTFSAPVVLSEQTGLGGDHDAFVPSIAVNKAGVVAVAWYDTRGHRPDQAGWILRLRASLDGGRTWQPSVTVTDIPTVKDMKKGRDRLPGVGHTSGLVADADGVFHGLWVDGRGGIPQVYSATVAVRPRSRP